MMEGNTKETIKVIKWVELVFIDGQISKSIKENGKMEKLMELANWLKLMEPNILVHSRTKRKMDMVYTKERMDILMVEIGKMAN